MKDFNEITSHVLAIDKADGEKAISFYERKKNLEALACKVADELIAGRPVPVFNQAESITRIDGMLPALATELVRQHDMAIAHRTHLAERLETDGGENGARAAAILRGMNEAAEPSKEDELPTSGDLWPPRPTFQIHFVKTHGEGGGGCGVPVAGSGAGGGGSCQDITDRTARYYAHEAARREHALAKAAQERIRAAEERGFDKGRNKALSIVLNERGKWSKDVVRDVLGKVSESIVYMRKEG